MPSVIWLYHKIPKEWVVFSKPPFSGPEEVVKYIGRYTHRSAISNNRIISDKDGKIEFWLKNTRKNSRWEITSLPVATFIERFLYHVLPKQFHRIRYYGFLANGKAGSNIESIRQDMAVESVQALTVPEKGMACPNCEEGTMLTLVATSPAPICLTLWFVEFSSARDSTLTLWKNIKLNRHTGWGHLFATALMSLLCFALAWLSGRALEKLPVKIIK